MIHPASGKGRPARRPLLCTCDTVSEAMRVHRILIAAGIPGSWEPRAPYKYRVRSGKDLNKAKELLSKAGVFGD